MAELSDLFFNKYRKYTCRMAVLLVTLSVLLFFVVTTMRNYPASSTVVSPSGRYILENVRVGKIFTLGGMAYLRVIDRQHPQEVYRTPLYDTQSLDMRVTEDDSTVGIAWIYFNRAQKTFDIAMPQWESHWLNMFISNTPYVHLEN
ncbi:hypothetical protein FHW68_002649 [Pseudomonas sp. Tn43]|uniref:hypothetical protein n=1 Tax=unclassified Pseudomonas TaxID=196821 RepID=UPI000BAB8F38|nr:MULTISPECIES: hypothetical protein [unclassified Pseudomonas]MBB3241129.1 hypothetical protein [Pseudomonas sp. Tn43]PAU55483.1 hypothetical protein BZL43_18425 [Pseudomonas sp. PICF141]